MPDVQYVPIQHFITDSPRDWRESQGRLIGLMAREATGPDGILVLDDVPLVKPGTKSPGVHRQYWGVRAGVDNCQSLVDAVHLLPGAGSHRDTLGWCFGIDLYLPKAWTEEPKRCREASIPLLVTFHEKWRIALEEIDQARERRLPHRATTADCGYGDTQEFRAELRRWKEPYVLEVTSKEVRVVSPKTPDYAPGEHRRGRRGRRRLRRPHIPGGVPTVSPIFLAEGAKDWTTIRWGEGTKGPSEGRFPRRKVRV